MTCQRQVSHTHTHTQHVYIVCLMTAVGGYFDLLSVVIAVAVNKQGEKEKSLEVNRAERGIGSVVPSLSVVTSPCLIPRLSVDTVR